jgi:peptide/nickel transport system permease protein
MSVTTEIVDVPRSELVKIDGFPLIPVIILASIVLVAVFADVLAPYDPQLGTLSARFKPPAWEYGGSMAHLLGTDHVGRDVLSRLIFGARVSIIVGITAVIVAGVIGTGLGIISGYMGGWVDQVVMRVTDTWLALPALTFAIFLTAIVGPSELNIIIILGAVYWTRYARVIRGEVLSLKEREFVRLAIVAGCSKRTIMWRHILPNVLNSAIVLGTLMLGVVIVTEAALSFLGVGVPPYVPSWGVILAEGRLYIQQAPWLVIYPGVAIMLTIFGLNLFGDGLRDLLDPKIRGLTSERQSQT